MKLPGSSNISASRCLFGVVIPLFHDHVVGCQWPHLPSHFTLSCTIRLRFYYLLSQLHVSSYHFMSNTLWAHHWSWGCSLCLSGPFVWGYRGIHLQKMQERFMLTAVGASLVSNCQWQVLWMQGKSISKIKITFFHLLKWSKVTKCTNNHTIFKTH